MSWENGWDQGIKKSEVRETLSVSTSSQPPLLEVPNPKPKVSGIFEDHPCPRFQLALPCVLHKNDKFFCIHDDMRGYIGGFRTVSREGEGLPVLWFPTSLPQSPTPAANEGGLKTAAGREMNKMQTD
jgi:hypothetical protein